MLMMENLKFCITGPLEKEAAFAAVIALYYEAKILALPSLPIPHW